MRAGHLPDRDVRVRRRDPARLLLHGEGRHVHEHRPPRAARAQGPRPARRRARRLRDRAGDRAAGRAGLELRLAPRGVRRDGLGDAELREPELRQPRADRQALPQPGPRELRRDRRDVHREVQHRRRARPPRARRVAPGQGAAQRRVPVRAEHRAAARALAHRLDDAPLVRARRDPAPTARSTSTRPTRPSAGWPTARWRG